MDFSIIRRIYKIIKKCDSSCVMFVSSVCPSAWNDLSPTGGVFVKNIYIYNIKAWLRSDTSSLFVVLTGEPHGIIRRFSPKLLPAAFPMQLTAPPDVSSLSRLIYSFTPTRSPTAALFSPHCKVASASSCSSFSFFFSFCMTIRPICGPAPHCCWDFQTIEFI